MHCINIFSFSYLILSQSVSTFVSFIWIFFDLSLVWQKICRILQAAFALFISFYWHFFKLRIIESVYNFFFDWGGGSAWPRSDKQTPNEMCEMCDCYVFESWSNRLLPSDLPATVPVGDLPVMLPLHTNNCKHPSIQILYLLTLCKVTGGWSISRHALCERQVSTLSVLTFFHKPNSLLEPFKVTLMYVNI